MPVAIAGDVLGIVDLVVFVTMLAIVVVLWSLVQVRQPISGVPVIGTQAVRLIDGFRQQVVHLAYGLERFLDAQQHAATDLWNRFIGQYVTKAFAGWQTLVVGLGLKVEDLAQRTVPALQALVGGLNAVVVGQLVPQLHALSVRVVQDEDYARVVLAAEIASTGAAVAAAESEIAQLRGQVAQLLQALVAVTGTVATLAPYEQLLRQLAGFETTTAGGLTALGTEQQVQAGRIAGQQVTLQQLAALLGLAALTATQIGTLVRIAKDPCGICQGLDLGTVQARLSNLELWGEE